MCASWAFCPTSRIEKLHRCRCDIYSVGKLGVSIHFFAHTHATKGYGDCKACVLPGAIVQRYTRRYREKDRKKVLTACRLGRV